MKRQRRSIRAVMTRSYALLLLIVAIMGMAVTAWASPTGPVVTWTTEADFESGTLSNIDTTTSPGSFKIGAPKDFVTSATVTCVTPTKIYSTGVDRTSIAVVNSGTKTLVATIPLPKPAAGVVWNSHDNKLYVGQQKDNKVLVIDVQTDQVIATLTSPTVGNGTYAAAYNPVENRIYIANADDQTVSILDGASDTPLATVTVAAGASTATFDSATDKLYFTNKANQYITVIDGPTNRVEQNIQVAEVSNLIKLPKVDALAQGTWPVDKMILSWDYECSSPQQKVQLQIRMADDLTSLEEATFTGPGSSAQSWYETTCQEATNGAQTVTVDVDTTYKPAAQLQVKLVSDGLSTPMVHEVRLGYGFTIEASAGNGGSIDQSGRNWVPYGGSQTFGITPIPCYHIVDVVVDGVSVGPVASYTFANVTASHAISATFAPNIYTISASAGSGGTISPEGAFTASCGSDATFDIAADSCHHLIDVKVDGVSVGPVPTYTFAKVDRNHSIEAVFGSNSYEISISAGNGGTISGGGIVTCGSGGDVIITPAPCYHVVDVIVDGVSQGPLTSYHFSNVTANHTVYATFAINMYQLTATAGPGGVISPAGTTSVACGSSVTYAITVDPCYHVESIIIDGRRQEQIAYSYTFNNINANHTIEVTFALNTYVITATADSDGTINPSGAVSATCGTNQTFATTANPGSKIMKFVLDGSDVAPAQDGSYTLANIGANHTIHAAFGYTITASAGANGSISDAGVSAVAKGGDKTYTITPAAGYRVANVLVDGVYVGNVTSYTFTNVTGPHTISAIFMEVIDITGTIVHDYDSEFFDAYNAAQDYFEFMNYDGYGTVVSTRGIELTQKGSMDCMPADYSFQLTSPNSFKVSCDTVSIAISVAGATVTSNGNTLLPIGGTMRGEGNKIAFYDQNQAWLGEFVFTPVPVATVDVTAGAKGHIDPYPFEGNLIDTGDVATTYDIVPNAGYHVDDVKVNGTSVGAVASYTFRNVTGPQSINATFAANPPATITPTISNGTISPATAVQVPIEGTQKFTYTPNPGYQFYKVYVDGKEPHTLINAYSASYTFTNVTSDHTINVINYATITASAGANGTISPAGTTMITPGYFGDFSKNYTITPNTGYRVADVKVDGVSVGAVTSYRFVNVTTPHTISATFTQ